MDCGGLGTLGQNAAQHPYSSTRPGAPSTVLTILSLGIEATRDQAAFENQICKILFVPDLPCHSQCALNKAHLPSVSNNDHLPISYLVGVQFQHKQVDLQVPRRPGWSLIEWIDDRT